MIPLPLQHKDSISWREKQYLNNGKIATHPRVSRKLQFANENILLKGRGAAHPRSKGKVA